jgi:hypothetical protein
MAQNTVTQAIGPLVEGDLCDITVHQRDREGRIVRSYCAKPAVLETVDVDGRTRLLCTDCVARLAL